MSVVIKNFVMLVFLFILIIISGCLSPNDFKKKCLEFESISKSFELNEKSCGNIRLAIDYVVAKGTTSKDTKCFFDVIATPEKQSDYSGVDQFGVFRSCEIKYKKEIEDELNDVTVDRLMTYCKDWANLSENENYVQLSSSCGSNRADCCEITCNKINKKLHGVCLNKENKQIGDWRLDNNPIKDTSRYNEDQARFACNYEQKKSCYCTKTQPNDHAVTINDYVFKVEDNSSFSNLLNGSINK